MVDHSILMGEIVLSTKVSAEQAEIFRSIAEERGTTVSGLVREFIDVEVERKKVDWDAACFGREARDDEPRDGDASVDEILYGG